MIRHAREVSGSAVCSLTRAALLGGLVVLAACAVAVPELPQPRPIIIHSGARLRVDHERMKVVNEWVIDEQDNIVQDPSFLVETQPSKSEVYLWEQLDLL